jgi:starvation-inducible outer membrane lipoprotein
MKRFATVMGVTSRVTILALALVGAALLTSCSTAPVTQSEAVFKFSVLRYKEPVEVVNWSVDPTQSANPEGAALNIVTGMQHGDLGLWLASWATDERPNPNQAERDSLVQKWQSLKNGRITMLGRVVAGSAVVVELSVMNSQQKTEVLKLPLKRENGQWWLTAMDANSEFLNWENSANKIVVMADTRNLKTYLTQIKLAKR